MAIEVEGPDGSVVEFPDGTDNATIEGAMAKHFGPPASPQHQATEQMGALEKGGKALAYGAEQAVRGVSSTMKMLGAPQRNMADRLADNIHQDAGLANYESAGAGLSDGQKGIMERLSYAPRALLEGAPGMAMDVGVGSLTGGAGFIANNVARNAGHNAEAIKQADGTTGQDLSPSQMARLALLTGGEAALNLAGAKATLKPTGIGRLANAAGTDFAAGAAQPFMEKAAINGEIASPEDAVVGGVTGATAGLAVRAPFEAVAGAQHVANTGARSRAEALSGLNPESVERFANMVDQRGTGSDKASADAIRHARTTLGSNMNTYSQGFSGDALLDSTKAHLRNGQVIDPADLETLRQRYSGVNEGDNLLRSIEDLNTANHVTNEMGNLRGDTFSGGVMGSDFGREWMTPFEGRRSGLQVAHGLFNGAGEAAKIPLWGAGSLYDKATGQSNPLGRFTKEYATGEAPKPITTPFRADMRTQEMEALSELTSGIKAEVRNDFADRKRKARIEDQANKTTDRIGARLEEQIGNKAVREVKARQKAQALTKAQEGKPLPAKDQPNRVFNDMTNGEVSDIRRGIQGIMSTRRMQKQANADQARADAQEQTGLLRANKGIVALRAQQLAQRLAEEKQRLALMQNSEEASASDASLALRVARLKASLAGDEEADVVGSVEEAPAGFQTFDEEHGQYGSSNVDQNLLRTNLRLKKLMEQSSTNENNASPPTAPVEPPEAFDVKTQAKVESIKKKASSQKATGDSESISEDVPPDLAMFEYDGSTFTLPRDKIRVGEDNWKAGIMKNAEPRRQLIEQMKSAVRGKATKAQLDKLKQKWNSGIDADQAYSDLEDLVNSDHIPESEKSKLYDLWNEAKIEWTWKQK